VGVARQWQGFEDRGHCYYLWIPLLPVTRGGIRETVSLSQAQGCTRNAMTKLLLLWSDIKMVDSGTTERDWEKEGEASVVVCR